MHKSLMNTVFVHLARQPPCHGSELEQDERLCGPDAAGFKMPGVVELAAGRERGRGGVIGWTGGSARLQCATIQFGHRLMVHLVVEELGKIGWDWHVWVQAGWTWARYGLAETAENAREQAEWALAGLMRSDADGNAPLCPNCRFVLFPQRSA